MLNFNPISDPDLHQKRTEYFVIQSVYTRKNIFFTFIYVVISGSELPESLSFSDIQIQVFELFEFLQQPLLLFTFTSYTPFLGEGETHAYTFYLFIETINNMDFKVKCSCVQVWACQVSDLNSTLNLPLIFTFFTCQMKVYESACKMVPAIYTFWYKHCFIRSFHNESGLTLGDLQNMVEVTSQIRS